MTPIAAKAVGMKEVEIGDVTKNLRGGAAYLRQMLDRFDGDTTLALAAYNAGPTAVLVHGGIPPFAETERFVARVRGLMR